MDILLNNIHLKYGDYLNTLISRSLNSSSMHQMTILSQCRIWAIPLVIMPGYPLSASVSWTLLQLGPRSGPIRCQFRPESKLFDTQMVFVKEIYEKLILYDNKSSRLLTA